MPKPLKVDGITIAPAICYESLQPEHARIAHQLGAEIYLASVAKAIEGIEKAMAHYPTIAKKYSMTVLMVNCVGYCDNFMSWAKCCLDQAGTVVRISG